MIGLRRTLIGGLGALAAGTLVLGAVSALQSGSADAQESTATPSETPSAVPRLDGMLGVGPAGHFDFHLRLGDGTFLADLAEKLGITEDELRAAIDAVKDDRLDEAVANGDLTQEQVDELRARRAEIEDAIANGTLDDLMKSQMQERMQSRLDEAVANGNLTQEQADQILQAVEDGNLREVLDSLDLEGFRFFGGHFRGPRGNGFGFFGIGSGDDTQFHFGPIGSGA